jgi:hypothetical protein
MALILSDRVKETTITTGTNDLVLGAGDFGAFETFSQGIGDGNQTYYAIENFGRWEVGLGTYTTGTNTLSRDTVLSSSNSDAKVLLDGPSVVFCTYPGPKSFVLDGDGVASGISGYSGLGFPDGTVQLTAPAPSGYLASPSDGSTPLTVVRTTAGNLFHAYVDNASDETVGLHLENSTSPTWKLGLKDDPTSYSVAPSYGYVFGKNGSAGVYSNADTSALVNYSNGFWITHQDSTMLNVGRTAGMVLYGSSASAVGVTVKGAVSQSANLQQWTNSSDTVLASISSAGAITVPTLYFADGTSQTTSSKAGWRTYKTISADATIAISDCVVFIDSTSESIEATLPTAAGNGGKEFIFKRASGSNNATINTYSSETIDGESSFTLDSLYVGVTLVSNNSNWYLV